MKTKVRTYALLLIVLIVWGTISYRIVSAVSGKTPKIKTPKLSTEDKSQLKIKKDTFSIRPLSRDPFLGIVHESTKKKSVIIKKEKKNIWKSIDYLGVIANGRDKVFIIKISNKELLLRKGQQLEKVKLIRGNKKQITLRFNNEDKIFKLKS